MAEKKPRPTKEELERLYFEEEKSKKEMKIIYRVGDKTLKSWFMYYNIPSRSRNKAIRLVKKRNSKWTDKDTWVEYGIHHGYSQISTTSLLESEDQIKISWYYRGMKLKDKNGESLVKSFPFSRRRIDNGWKTKEEWTQHGFEQRYNERSPSELKKGDKEGKSWYFKGQTRKWTKFFDFNRMHKPKGYWKNLKKVKAELRRAIEKNGGKFPTQRELTKLGFSKLINAMKIHGGMKFLKEKMGYVQVKTNNQFMDFLKQDETARNLAGLVVVNGQGGYDIEKVMVELYGNKFSNHPDLHKLLQENEDSIKVLIENGITNLGAYIGEYSLGDRAIIPILIGQALTEIPDKLMTISLEDRLFRSLRSTYSPKFNENPEDVLTEVKEKVDSTKGKEKSLYQRLQTHYENVISLGGELNA